MLCLKRRIEILFTNKCINLYSRSIFCLQEGADSSTRKGLWDGMISGCIPVFFNGVLANEFDCFGLNNSPWAVTLKKNDFVRQLLAMHPDYISLLRLNIQRMIPKIIYTRGL